MKINLIYFVINFFFPLFQTVFEAGVQGRSVRGQHSVPVQPEELQDLVHHQQRELLLQTAFAEESGTGH